MGGGLHACSTSQASRLTEAMTYLIINRGHVVVFFLMEFGTLVPNYLC
jgi:hypothetical protein